MIFFTCFVLIFVILFAFTLWRLLDIKILSEYWFLIFLQITVSKNLWKTKKNAWVWGPYFLIWVLNPGIFFLFFIDFSKPWDNYASDFPNECQRKFKDQVMYLLLRRIFIFRTLWSLFFLYSTKSLPEFVEKKNKIFSPGHWHNSIQFQIFAAFLYKNRNILILSITHIHIFYF